MTRETSIEIASMAGRILAAGNPLDNDQVILALIEQIAASNSGAEAKQAFSTMFQPYFDNMLSLAGSCLAQREINPVGQVVRLTKQGVARVLNGHEGMLFNVERRCGVDDRCVLVHDYRFPNSLLGREYQPWTLGPDDFELASDSAADDVPVLMKIDWQRVTDLIVGAIEGGYSPWLHSFIPRPDDPSATLYCQDQGEGIWYGRQSYWQGGGAADIEYDLPEESEGAWGGKAIFGPEEIRKGLTTMAAKYPRHFADLISEGDDAITHDVFMQCAILGEIVYS